MSKAKQLSEHEKGQIDALFAAKRLSLNISLKIGRSRNVISSYQKQGANYGTKPRSGRPCSISPRKAKAIVKEAAGKIITVNQIKANLEIDVSKNTVCRIIHRYSDLKRKKLKRKPVLSNIHKEKRVIFAKQYMDLGERWKYVIFSDEKKFNLDGPDGYDYYWHALGTSEPVLSRRAMGGGSVMVWACFDFFGKSKIIVVDGSINSLKYQKILEDHMLPLFRSRASQYSVFQQDNARPHVSNSTLGWLRSNGIETMQWPPYSPDLNPIENLWGDLVRRVYANGRQFANIDQLQKAIEIEWEKIDKAVIESLSLSMKERIFYVLTKNGSNTKY